MRPRYSCLSLKLIFLKTEMKKIVLKKKRRTSFFEGKSRGELINTWDPIGPSITINVICEAEKKKKGVIEVVRRRFRFDRSWLFPTTIVLLKGRHATRKGSRVRMKTNFFSKADRRETMLQPRAPSAARGVVPWTVYFWTCKYRFAAAGAARRHSRGVRKRVAREREEGAKMILIRVEVMRSRCEWR